MRRLLQSTCPLGDPDIHAPQWEYYIRWHPRYWKTLVRRAVSLATLHLQDQDSLLRAHADIWDTFAQRGSCDHLPLWQAISLAACSAVDNSAVKAVKVHTSFDTMARSTASATTLMELLAPIVSRSTTLQGSCSITWHKPRHAGLLSWHVANYAIQLLVEALRLNKPNAGLMMDSSQLCMAWGHISRILGEPMRYDLDLLDKFTNLFLNLTTRDPKDVMDQISTLMEEQVYSWTTFHGDASAISGQCD